MSNPIWAMLIGVGVGLAVSLYMYYQETRARPLNAHNFGNRRPPNQVDGDWERPRANTGAQSHRTSRRSGSPHAEGRESCIICMDDYGQDTWRVLSCEHRFHAKCISMWLNMKNTCPTCRMENPSSI